MENIRKRNGAIDFWKFVFALIIVQFHSSNFDVTKSCPFIGGAIAVEFYFIVSGFLMAESICKKNENEIVVGRDSKNFIFHKIRGLCPEIFIAWGIGYVVQHLALNHVTITMLIKDLISGIWDLFFLRESGLVGFRANPAAWYISAMILAMMILVPLFLKNRDVFLNVVAPILAVAILGYLSKTVGDLRGPTEWMGICYRGLPRAIGELCLGCLCWSCCQKIKQKSYTKLARVLFTVSEFSCYLGVIVWSYGHKGSQMDFVMLLLFAVGVTLTFSGQNLIAGSFNNPFIYFLGKISFSIYLAHNYWSHFLIRMYPKQSYAELYPKYVILVIITTTVIYWTAKMIRKIGPGVMTKCHEVFIQEK